jgi:hypothetical protein
MKFFFRSLLVISFLILIYIFYKSEISWQGTKRSYYLIYYIGTLLTIFFLIICSYLNLKIQKYLIIIFISIVFTLYSYEGKLTFDKKNTNLNFDRRTLFEVYEDMKKTNLNVTIITPPAIFLNFTKLDLFGLAGISKAKTIFCNESGYYAIYNSDRHGFNNPDKEWNAKEIEYFLIGDSFAHGACVNRPDDIASVLRRHSKKNVLNLGQSSTGPLIQYATLREYLPPNIKNVLWLYYEGNDLSDLENELKNNILKKYLSNKKFKQDLKFKQTQVDQFLTTYLERERERERERKIIKIIKFIKLLNIRSLLFTQPQPEPQLSELKIILNLANELVNSHNGKLYFVYLPKFDRYTKLLKKDYKQQIKKKVIDLGIEFIDIDDEVFKKEKNPSKLFPFEKYNHYTVEAYKIIALKIYEKTK